MLLLLLGSARKGSGWLARQMPSPAGSSNNTKLPFYKWNIALAFLLPFLSIERSECLNGN